MTKLKIYSSYGRRKIIPIHFISDPGFLAAKIKKGRHCQFTILIIKIIIKMG